MPENSRLPVQDTYSYWAKFRCRSSLLDVQIKHLNKVTQPLWQQNFNRNEINTIVNKPWILWQKRESTLFLMNYIKKWEWIYSQFFSNGQMQNKSILFRNMQPQWTINEVNHVLSKTFIAIYSYPFHIVKRQKHSDSYYVYIRLVCFSNHQYILLF